MLQVFDADIAFSRNLIISSTGAITRFGIRLFYHCTEGYEVSVAFEQFKLKVDNNVWLQEADFLVQQWIQGWGNNLKIDCLIPILPSSYQFIGTIFFPKFIIIRE